MNNAYYEYNYHFPFYPVWNTLEDFTCCVNRSKTNRFKTCITIIL